MDNNLLVFDKKMYTIAENAIDNSRRIVFEYYAERSESSAVYMLLSLLKHEYVDILQMPEWYEKFISDLINMMSHTSKDNVCKNMNLNDIIQKAPYMTTKAIESTIVKFVDTVALHELLIEEFKKYPQ